MFVAKEMSAVKKRIALAREKYYAYGERLLEIAEIRELLKKLDNAINASRRCMIEVGLVEICRKCAMEGKCCCRKWVEDEYDEYILLINFLLGVEPPSERVYPNACFFVGPKGCRLKAREVICVDFLCDRVKDELGHEKVVKIQRVIGDELETAFLLKEKIKTVSNTCGENANLFKSVRKAATYKS